MKTQTPDGTAARKRILVLQPGFVFIGLETSRGPAGIVLEEAFCIRKWGTTRGLGQIALSGPTEDTALDPCGTVTAPLHAEVLSIDCAV